MRLPAISALQGMAILASSLSFGGLALAGAPGELRCPPEEQAVLVAYQHCVEFYRQGDSAGKGADLEARAARLGNACSTETSEFIGVDPYQDLLECAQAMAEGGQVAQARTVEPVAQAYRAEQMRRLAMHGGELLDPARYMGRPSDYERRSAIVGPVEERITTEEFSAGKPKGGGWKLLTGERMPVVYWKDPAWMSSRPVKGQNVAVVLTTRSPGFALAGSAADFPRALEALLRRDAGKRSQILSLSATHAREPADYCADYVLIVEEPSNNPNLAGVVLETTTTGFACLERSSRVVIQAYYEESRPRGAPSVLDDVLRGEAEAFLRDISFVPKR